MYESPLPGADSLGRWRFLAAGLCAVSTLSVIRMPWSFHPNGRTWLKVPHYTPFPKPTSRVWPSRGKYCRPML